MNVSDFRLGRIARRHLEDNLLSLAPGDSPVPFMVGGGPHGDRRVELHPLTDSDFPATAETVIPAFIVLDEAFEIVLATFTTEPELCGPSPECALIAHWGPHGRDLFTAAPMRRTSQPPVLGEWLEGPASVSLGPVEEGVREGLAMAHRMWDSAADELRERIDSIRATARCTDTDVLPLTVDALNEWGWLG
jgi:hypothetical protein